MLLLQDIALFFLALVCCYWSYKCLIAFVESWEADKIEKEAREIKQRILEGKE